MLAGVQTFGLPTVAAAPATSRATQPANDTVLVVGDSLSAEYGLSRGTGWVALLEARIRERGWTPSTLPQPSAPAPAIVNASISGETTAGGLSRLPDLLQRHSPAIVVIALGGNDALRGLDLSASERNLARMIELARAAGARVLLVGMMVPPNYGRAYGERFTAIFTRLAQQTGVALVPFLLDGFADDMTQFQPDRIHPRETAQPRMLENVWPVFESLGRRAAASRQTQ
ncbi:MAG: arylesterase [Lautropia sp.]